MPSFNMENYETVEERLEKFWAQHPEGRIATNVEELSDDKNIVVFRASVYFNINDKWPTATGYAEEIRGSTTVNKTSFVENCETSAIGRALANCGYAAKGARASRTEMEKVANHGQSPVRTEPDTATGASAPTRTIRDPGVPASVKQLGLIRAMIRDKGMDEDEGHEYAGVILGRAMTSFTDLTMGDASALITGLKSIHLPASPEEEAF